MALNGHDPLCSHSDVVQLRLSPAVCSFCALIGRVRAHDAALLEGSVVDFQARREARGPAGPASPGGPGSGGAA